MPTYQSSKISKSKKSFSSSSLDFQFQCIILVRQFLQMRNYSFSNIASDECFASRKSTDLSNPIPLRHHQEPITRMEQIKKNYDTPSRGDTVQSRDFELQQRQKLKENKESQKPQYDRNPLKESFAVNRIQKPSLKFDETMGMAGTTWQTESLRARQIEKENDYGVSKEGEATFFNKMKEMKESILNQDYSRANTRGSVPSFNKYADNKHEGRKEFDPRVENIDKINSKIKQILQNLSDNQKYAKQQTKQERNTSKDSAVFGYRPKETHEIKRTYENNLHRSIDIGAKPSSNDLQKPPIDINTNKPPSAKYDFYSKPTFDNPTLKSRECPIKKIEAPMKESMTFAQKFDEQITRTPTYPSKDIGIASRSRSQIDSSKRSSTPNDGILKSGKKVNDEIDKIQKKIEEFEMEKRKLNIEFTPFNLKNKSTANLSNGSITQTNNTKIKDFTQKTEDNQETKIQQPSRFAANQRSSSNDLKFKSYLNRAADYSQKYGNLPTKDRETSKSSIYDKPPPKPSQDYELKIQKYPPKDIQINQNDREGNEQEYTSAQEQSTVIEFDESALKRRTDEGIEQRRRRRMDNKEGIITTETLKSFVSLFCEQVRLDECLRNMKIWLESCPDAEKMAKVSKALEEQGIRLTPADCSSLFTLNQSQNNPFFSVQGFAGSYSCLAQAFCSSKQNWQTKIQHKFCRSSLQGQGFTSQRIDLQRKGFIELQDLVRFLNIESGTFFRNRDLFLIFRRFSKGDRVDFEGLMGEVCCL